MKKLCLFGFSAAVLCSSCGGGKKITPNPKPEDWKEITQISDVQDIINSISNNTNALAKLPEYVSATVKNNKATIVGVDYDIDGQIIAFSNKDKYFKQKLSNVGIKIGGKDIYSYTLVDKEICYNLSYNQTTLKKMKKVEGDETAFFPLFQQIFSTVAVVKSHLDICKQTGGSYKFYKLDYDANSLKGEINYTIYNERHQISFDIADNKFITFGDVGTASDGKKILDLTYVYDYDTIVTKDPEANPDTWYD